MAQHPPGPVQRCGGVGRRVRVDPTGDINGRGRPLGVRVDVLVGARTGCHSGHDRPRLSSRQLMCGGGTHQPERRTRQ